MNMVNCLIYVIALTGLALLCPSFVFSLTYCQKGAYEYLPKRGREVCLECPEGTFMPHHDHRHKECYNCTKIEDEKLEILITPCTRIDNTVINCVKGYYRTLPANPREKERCEKCTDCTSYGMYTTVACQNDGDTFCCPGDHFVALPDKNGVLGCWETPWLCRQGEYFDRESAQCFPCSDNTYMSKDYHSMTECNKCWIPTEYDIPKHAIVILPCSRTHPTIIGCKDGFYISHSLGYNEEDIGCTPCKNCSETDEKYEARKCDGFRDRVCCSQPNMTVVDTLEGPSCKMEATIATETTTTKATTTTTAIEMTITIAATSSPPQSLASDVDAGGLSDTVIILIIVTILLATVTGVIKYCFLSRYGTFHLTFGSLIFWFTRRVQRNATDEEQVPLNKHCGNYGSETSRYKKDEEKIEAILQEIKLDNDMYKRVLKVLEEEMNKGLQEQAKTDTKMYPTCVTSLADGTEKGLFLALAVDGSYIRVKLIEFEEDAITIIGSKKYIILQSLKQGPGTQLFDHIASYTGDLISRYGKSDETLSLGFSFAFPCRHESIAKAQLTTWTKGFYCDGVVDKDIGDLLQKAFARKTSCKVKIVAVVTKTVATLMAATHHGKPDCEIGLVIGAGYNVCYMEQLGNVKMWKNSGEMYHQPRQVINTDLGAFGDNGCLDFIRTDYDKAFDKGRSSTRVMENMISCTYLGDIAWMVLGRLANEGFLFETEGCKWDVFEHKPFTTKRVSKIESGVVEATKQVLDEMGFENYTDEDCILVKKVCTLIFERAAYLAATGVAVIINRLSRPDVTIAVDGSLYRSHRRLYDLLCQKVKELVRPGLRFQLVEADDGDTTGAALAAAVALKGDSATSSFQ